MRTVHLLLALAITLAATCRRIRATWSEAEERKRAAWWYQRAEVQPVFMPEWAGFGEPESD